jgi:hypothetical protein
VTNDRLAIAAKHLANAAFPPQPDDMTDPTDPTDPTVPATSDSTDGGCGEGADAIWLARSTGALRDPVGGTNRSNVVPKIARCQPGRPDLGLRTGLGLALRSGRGSLGPAADVVEVELAVDGVVAITHPVLNGNRGNAMTRANDPLRRAATALARGDSFFEIQRPVCDVLVGGAVLSAPASQGRRDDAGADVVAAIERLGWRLEHVNYLFVPLPEPDARTSRRPVTDLRGPAVGVVLGAYLFQLPDRRPRPGQRTAPMSSTASSGRGVESDAGPAGGLPNPTRASYHGS